MTRPRRGPAVLGAAAAPIAVALCLTACATTPTGPSVMALPGSGRTIEQFNSDDAACREWAAKQIAAEASRAQGAHTGAQRRYDVAYMQCIYAKGDRIPVPASEAARYSTALPTNIPPPPAGTPPAPPPQGAAR